MKLSTAEIKAKQLIKEHLPSDWSFIWTNGTSTLGVCIHSTKQIGLSKIITELNTYRKIEKIILHEIAHALLSPKHAHSKKWKQIAIQLGVDPTTGCNVIAPNCYNYQCPNCKIISNEKKKYKYEEACADCCKKYNNGKHSNKYIYKLIKNTVYK